MNNLTEFNKFRNKKDGSKLNEGVIKIGNDYIISDIELPASLVNSYIKKVKDERGKDLREMMADQDVAMRLVKYAMENFMQIDNMPTSIVLGEEEEDIDVQDTQAQTQPQTQTQGQPQGQPQPQTQGQPQSQGQPQGGQETQGQSPQQTTQEIPSQEGGEESQEI